MLSYPGTDIYLVSYACNERSSLNNIQHKWMSELKRVENDPWFIMVGTKVPAVCGMYEAEPDIVLSLLPVRSSG